MSEKRPIYTIVKKGSAYESRHRTPERDQEMERQSPPMFTSPTARNREELQAAFCSLVTDAKDNKRMARTTVSFPRRLTFRPAFILTPSIF